MFSPRFYLRKVAKWEPNLGNGRKLLYHSARESKILFQTIAPEKITGAHCILNETLQIRWMIILMVTAQKENREEGDGQAKMRLYA